MARGILCTQSAETLSVDPCADLRKGKADKARLSCRIPPKMIKLKNNLVFLQTMASASGSNLGYDVSL